MKKYSVLAKIYFSLLIIFSIAGFGYLHYSNDSIHAQPTTILSIHHNKRHHDNNYRVYSQHYLTVEHRDLNLLKNLGNHYARLTNSVYENDYNGTHPIYHKFHDHMYWSVFKTQNVPSNFRHSHISKRNYRLIQHRVLRSHGVYTGVNFHKYNNLNEKVF